MLTSGIDSGTTEPLLIDARTVGLLLGRCERTIRLDDKLGRLPKPATIGGTKRWSLEDLRRWTLAGCPSRSDWESHRLKVSARAAGPSTAVR